MATTYKYTGSEFSDVMTYSGIYQYQQFKYTTKRNIENLEKTENVEI